jgi:thyroid hormone receptor beta
MVFVLKFVVKHFSIQYRFSFQQIIRPCQYDGKCEMNMLTRKQCTACRLEKCVSVGMSKDLIRKELDHDKSKSLSTEYKKTRTSQCKTIVVCNK